MSISLSIVCCLMEYLISPLRNYVVLMLVLYNLLTGFANSCSGIPSCSTPPPAFEDAVRGDTPLRHRNPHHIRSYREESARWVFSV